MLCGVVQQVDDESFTDSDRITAVVAAVGVCWTDVIRSSLSVWLLQHFQPCIQGESGDAHACNTGKTTGVNFSV